MSRVTCLNCRLVVPHPVWSAAILNFPIVCVTTCRLVIPHPVWSAAESRITCVHVVVVWSYHTRCGPLLSHILRVTCCKMSFGHAIPGVVRLYGTYCLFKFPPPPLYSTSTKKSGMDGGNFRSLPLDSPPPHSDTFTNERYATSHTWGSRPNPKATEV